MCMHSIMGKKFELKRKNETTHFILFFFYFTTISNLMYICPKLKRRWENDLNVMLDENCKMSKLKKENWVKRDSDVKFKTKPLLIRKRNSSKINICFHPFSDELVSQMKLSFEMKWKSDKNECEFVFFFCIKPEKLFLFIHWKI